MNQTLALLSVSYVFLVVFVVWIGFGKKFSVLHKILLSVLLPVVYFFHWSLLQQTKGWPSDEILPQQFELLAADIVEPNPAQSIKGNIHLWIRPDATSPPRSYILPYTRQLHEKLFETKQRIAKGRAQIGLLYAESSGASGASIGGGMKLGFRNAPRKRLPPK